MVLLQAVAILVGIFSLIYLYFKSKFSYWKNLNVAYIEPTIPKGNLKDVGTKYHVFEVIEKFYSQLKGNGKFFGIYLFTQPAVVVTDMELVKAILVKDANSFMNRGMYYNQEDDPLSAHLFNIDQPHWKVLRSKLSPTFSSGKMKMMFPTIANIGKKFVEVLERECKNVESFEIKDILARFTTDVIGSCAFGLDCNSLDDPQTEFRVMGEKCFTKSKIFDLEVSFMANFRSLARTLHMKLIPADISNFYTRVVRDTIEYREKHPELVRNDFMNLLIQMKNFGIMDNKEDSDEQVYNGKLTFEEIAAQAFIFFLGGFETSSTTMTFSLYELSLHQDVQEKARKHIISILKKHGGKFTYEAALEMTYIEQFINEALRKYPTLSNINRVAEVDYKVEGTNLTIKKGQMVIIPASAIHHDPEYYPNPQKFDPERFSPEETRKRNPYAFLGFGQGPRFCIGMRFGLLQSTVGLASLLLNFKFERCSKSVVPIQFMKDTFVLAAEGGVYLKITKIDNDLDV